MSERTPRQPVILNRAPQISADSQYQLNQIIGQPSLTPYRPPQKEEPKKKMVKQHKTARKED